MWRVDDCFIIVVSFVYWMCLFFFIIVFGLVVVDF